MATVTVSPKYQVVIPLEAREALGIRPGQKIEVVVYEGRLEFIPVAEPKEMRGFLRGIDTSVRWDDDRV
jgi:AbrB family looped-hinge helix DNA binding protein